MSKAINELLRVKDLIQINMRVAQAELEKVNKAIEVLRRAENQASSVSSQRTPVTQSGEFMGLTLQDACRRVVGEDPMLPSEVCDILVQRGYPVPELDLELCDLHRRFYMNVFVTLKRLADRKDLVRGTKDGKFAVHKPAKEASLVPVHGPGVSSPI